MVFLGTMDLDPVKGLIPVLWLWTGRKFEGGSLENWQLDYIFLYFKTQQTHSFKMSSLNFFHIPVWNLLLQVDKKIALLSNISGKEIFFFCSFAISN